MEVDRDFWHHKRIFITGGTGFVGSHLVSKLKSLGAIVKTFVHERFSNDGGVFGDLCTVDDRLHRFLSAYQPEIVFHLAAQPIVNRAVDKAMETLEVNIKGTYNLLAAVQGLPNLKSLVHISTDKVYGNTDVITKSTIPYGVEHPYNASKLSGDVLAQMYGNTFRVPITVIRNGNVYGGGDLHWDRIVPGNIKRIHENLPPIMRGDGSARRDYIYVGDVVTGYLNAAQFGMNTKLPIVLNLGAKQPTTVLQMMDVILKVMNRVDLSPAFESMGHGEIPHQHIDDDTAERLIGWCPETDLEQGLKYTVDWYRRYFGQKSLWIRSPY